MSSQCFQTIFLLRGDAASCETLVLTLNQMKRILFCTRLRNRIKEWKNVFLVLGLALKSVNCRWDKRV
jgi:hypothetical protein